MKTGGPKASIDNMEVRSVVKSQTNSVLKKSSKSFGELKYNTMQKTRANDLISEIDEGD